MHKKTLLLNYSYEVISFIPERRALKLLMKGKCEVISFWNEVIKWGSGQINHPSILRLKKLVRRNFFSSNFSRRAVIKRDCCQCQYCGLKLTGSQITIDHVIPRAQGGANSFLNCVVACKICNNRKDSRTPEQAGMSLIKKPMHPSFSEHFSLSDQQDHYHEDWQYYLI